MAKCNRCGKGGFFKRVNPSGFCNNCETILALEAREVELNQSVFNLDQILGDKQVLYTNAYNDARNESLGALESEINQKKAYLSTLIDSVAEQTFANNEITEKNQKAERSAHNAANKVKKAKTLMESIKHAIQRYDQFPDDYKPFTSVALDSEISSILQPTIELRLHCLDVRQLRKEFKENQKAIEDILIKYQGRYTTKANATIYQLMVIALKAELQNILYNINFGKLEKATDAVKEVAEKYLVIAIDGNQNIAPTMKKFIGEIEYLFTKAVKIEYEYFVQKERIKEEQRMLRDQMRQDAAEKKALEEQRKQIEKEESKYTTEIDSLADQLSNTEDTEKINQLQARIDELKLQLAEVEVKKDEIIKLQNGKAGYVYIISNLGSFGDDVFKIGMTRRLEPQDRVNELGSASVPFPFDVHSFIFSDDAVNLESQMHKSLHEKRINRVNVRKEFFKVTVEELEELTFALEPTAEFKNTLMAEQYYQSLSVEEVPEESCDTDYEDDDEDEIA